MYISSDSGRSDGAGRSPAMPLCQVRLDQHIGPLQFDGLRACCKTGWCARAYRRKTRNDSLLGSDAAPRSRPKIASIWSRIQRSKVVSGLARIGVDVISSLSLPTTKKPRPGRVAASTSRRSLQSGTTRPQVRLTRTEHLGYDAADIG